MNPDLNAQYTYWIFVSCSINLIETIILFWYLYIFKCNGLNTIIFFKLMLLNFFLGFNSWIIQQYQRHLTRQNSQNHIHHQYKERGLTSLRACILPGKNLQIATSVLLVVYEQTRSRLQRRSVSLAWNLGREMRKRLILRETKQIYSLNVFYFLLYRRRYFLLVSELI